MMSWTDVTNDERFKTLSEADKSDIRQEYFDNIVSKDPRYEGLPDTDKMDIQKEFFGKDVPQSFIDKGLQRTKEFFWDKPNEAAATIRGNLGTSVALLRKGTGEPLSPQEAMDAQNMGPVKTAGDITTQAQQTGKVPYGQIAARVATDTLADFIPITPTEIAGAMLGGRLVSKAGALAGNLAEMFPKTTAVLSKINTFGRGAQTIEEKSLALASKMIDDLKPEELPKPGAAQTPGVPPTEAPPAAAAVGEAAPSPAAPLPETPTPAALETKLPEANAATLPEKDVYGRQLAKFDTTNDVRGIIKETSDMIKETIKPERLNRVSVEETKALADKLGWDYDTLIKNRGRAFNTQELHVADGLTSASGEEVKASLEAWKAAPTIENMIAAQAATARHALVQQTFYESRAEAGRALNILKLVTKARRGTSEAAKIGDANISKIIEAMGGNDVSEEFVKRLAMLDPQNMAEVNAFARNVFKATTSQKVYEVYINSILSSPATLARNTIGNAAFLAAKPVEKVFRGGVDAVASAVTGNARTAYAGEAVPEMLGIFQGLKDATRVGVRRLLSDADETVTKLDLNRAPAISGLKGKVIRTPTRILTATDEFFKTLISRSELNAQAYRAARQEGLKGAPLIKRMAELVEKPTAAISKAVDEEALYRTFQNENSLADSISSIRRVKYIGPVAKYVLPFIKTPVNIAAAGLERTPLGAIKIGADLITKQGQAAFSRDAGSMLMGSTIAATVAAYTLAGKITGSAPRDKVKRDQFFRSGKLPYAIKIGDTWHSYSAFEPLSMVLGATADTVNMARDKKSEPDANMIAAIPFAISKYLVSKTFLSGLRDVVDGIGDPERFGSNLANTLSQGLVPASGLMRYIAFQMDPIVRETGGDSANPLVSMYQGARNSVQAIIPGASKSLPPKVNAYGEDIRRPEGVVIQKSRERFNPLDQEDDMLDHATGFVSQKMAGVKLTHAEHVALMKDRGDMIMNVRKQLLQSPDWKTLPADEKRMALDRLTNAAANEAKLGIFERVLKRLPDGEDKDTLINYGVNTLGIDPEQVMAMTGGNGGTP